MTFSIITEFVILFVMTSPFWHMLLISRAAGHTLLQTTFLQTIMLFWTAYGFFVVTYAFDAPYFGVLAPALPVLYITLAASVAYLARNWILGNGVSQHILIGLQLFRPVGGVFVLEDYRGTLPTVFAQPAGWGDVMAGIIAAFVLAKFWNTKIPRNWVIFVAVFGLADFASALFFGVTSSDTPFQLFSHDAPNRVREYPLGLIPLFLVPYAVVAHILSLTQLANDRKNSPSK
ncbi:MAG: hypothetical protein AAGF53_15510 [Pseudomonadota bacterium]